MKQPINDPDSLAAIFGKAVYSYTRANAIADGVLVPVPELDAALAGIVLPLAVNASVWGAANADDLADRASMLAQTRTAMGNVASGSDRAYFDLVRPNGSRFGVVIHCGPGDDAAPVLTLCEPSDL